jgi:hypothetical protein
MKGLIKELTTLKIGQSRRGGVRIISPKVKPDEGLQRTIGDTNLTGPDKKCATCDEGVLNKC